MKSVLVIGKSACGKTTFINGRFGCPSLVLKVWFLSVYSNEEFNIYEITAPTTEAQLLRQVESFFNCEISSVFLIAPYALADSLLREDFTGWKCEKSVIITKLNLVLGKREEKRLAKQILRAISIRSGALDGAFYEPNEASIEDLGSSSIEDYSIQDFTDAIKALCAEPKESSSLTVDSPCSIASDESSVQSAVSNRISDFFQSLKDRVQLGE